jgi:hypothetical protein
MKIVLVKKKRTVSETPVCDYLEGLAHRAFSSTGEYPKEISLSQKSYTKMRTELKGLGGWADSPMNYRGIPIKVVGTKKVIILKRRK